MGWILMWAVLFCAVTMAAMWAAITRWNDKHPPLPSPSMVFRPPSWTDDIVRRGDNSPTAINDSARQTMADLAAKPYRPWRPAGDTTKPLRRRK